MRPTATVLVSTYNEPAYLELLLLALRAQTVTDFEVIVADDGSGPETKRVIEEARGAFRHPLTHVWQEHEGFGKTAILNKAARLATSEYLIFHDGDCIAHPRFVEEHLGAAEPGRFLVGRYPRLSRKETRRITRDGVARGVGQRMTITKALDGLFGKTKRIELGFYVRSKLLRYFLAGANRNTELFGGNFSCYAADFQAINGFNEAFKEFGGEDVDLGMRLAASGLQVFSVANRAINFHLFHERPLEWRANPELKRAALAEIQTKRSEARDAAGPRAGSSTSP